MRALCFRALLAVALGLWGGMAVPAAHGSSYHVIIAGAGGQEVFQERFVDWATRLRDVLMTFDHPAERIFVLTESGAGGGKPAPMATTLETIHEVMEGLMGRVTREDDLFIYLIGHGSYLRDDSKLQIPGPDITARDMKGILEGFDARHVVIVNSASTSAGWINELSDTNRIICTSTRSIDQTNATEYMEHFVAALEEGSADRNHDDRISVLEACQQAAELTAAWYTRQGFVATEQGLIDDNGDGLGSRLPLMAISRDEFAVRTDEGVMPVFDGALADTVYVKDFTFPAHVPDELVDAYLAALDEVADLKREKEALDEDTYYRRLEVLLVRAATLNREIRTLSEGPASPQ